MPEPRAAEEWARKITGVKDDGYEWNIIIAKNLRAYAEQETTSQKLQIAVLIRLLERVRDAEDPEEYLDAVAAADEPGQALLAGDHEGNELGAVRFIPVGVVENEVSGRTREHVDVRLHGTLRDLHAEDKGHDC